MSADYIETLSGQFLFYGRDDGVLLLRNPQYRDDRVIKITKSVDSKGTAVNGVNIGTVSGGPLLGREFVNMEQLGWASISEIAENRVSISFRSSNDACLTSAVQQVLFGCLRFLDVSPGEKFVIDFRGGLDRRSYDNFRERGASRERAQ